MFREILFMLNGNPGAVFVLDNDGNFEISPGVPGFSPSEKQVLKPLLKIGSLYKCITEFVNCKPAEGMYLSSAKTGIQNCLKPYEDRILEIERTILYEGKQLYGITGIYSKVSQFELLLSALSNLVTDLKLKNPGSAILDILNQHKSVGICAAITAIESIVAECTVVLKKQLVSWLLFGKLFDPHREFFIKEAGTAKTRIIDTEFLPVSVISITQAQNALFIGESMIVLRKTVNHQTEEWSLMAVVKEIETSDFQVLLETAGNFVTKRLWSILNAENKLQQELAAIQNIFLMKRGEIFVHFITKASPLLDIHVPSSQNPGQLKTYQYGVQKRFNTALNSCSIDDDSVISQFSVKFQESTEETGWNKLMLDYKVAWPLDVLVFTAEVLETYNKIFRLLLQLRRVEIRLQKLWTHKKTNNTKILGLRWCFQHLFVHLCQYLQTDVIEVQKSLMDKSLKNCEDFERFRTAHALFLTTVTSQAFIHVPPMQDCIQSLIELGIKFCNVSEKLNETQGNFEEEMSQLETELQRQIRLLLTLLTAMHRRGSAAVLAPLAQLLLRLDFNHFFSKFLSL